MSQLRLALKELSKQLLKHYSNTVRLPKTQNSEAPQILFDAELSALPTMGDSAAATHILSFAVPSTVATQIGDTTSQLFVALSETKDETTVILDAETRILASTIFSKIVQKKTSLKAIAQ